MRPFIVLLIVITIGVGIVLAQSEHNGDQAPQFSQLSAGDAERLDQQRAVVAQATKQRYGTARLTKTTADLAALQKLIDDSVFAKSQTYELQCLGVAFGDVLASELPLHWVMVSDEYGADPTLRYKQTSATVNVLTMVSKRVEQGREVNLSSLLNTTREQLAKVDKELR